MPAGVPVLVLAQLLGRGVPAVLELLADRGSRATEESNVEPDIAAAILKEEHARRGTKQRTSSAPTKLASRLPLDPNRRRVIVVADPVSQLSARQEDVDVTSVTILRPPSRTPSQALDQQLYRLGWLRPNTVLIQSPTRTDEYRPLEEAAAAFALDKLMVYDRIAGFLGATEFSVEQLFVTSQNGEISVKASAQAPFGHANANVGKGFDGKLEEFLEVKSTYSPSEPDLDAASRVSEASNLGSDPALRHWITLRRDGLKPTGHQLRINLTQEARATLDLGLDVTSRLNIGGSAGASRQKDQVREVQILLKVEFEPTSGKLADPP